MYESATPTGNPARDRSVRTCVGCRKRAAAADLLRVTVTTGPECLLVPDPRRRRPGRGAHVHYDRDCVEVAVRRRAFVRALRVRRAPDPSALWEYITQQVGR